MKAMSLGRSITNTNQEVSKVVTDSDLVLAAKKEVRAFEKLYSKYYEPILRYVYQRVVTKEEAYDITSQVFLKAMQNLEKYEDRGLPFLAWLYRIAKSEVYQYHRENAKQPTFSITEDQMEHMVHEVEEHGVKVTNEQLIEWLSEVAEDDLPYIEMRYLEQRSFKEIGEILGISENNAKVKTHRIVQRWKKKIQGR